MIMPLRRALVLLSVFVAAGLPARAEEQVDPVKYDASLTYQQGKIAVLDGAVTLDLPPGYRFLGPLDARMVLSHWGNPGASDVEGMIVPSMAPILADGSWAVVLMLDKNGHVDDSNADTLNADTLLKEMKELNVKDNEKRKRQGLEPVTLLGWAEAPRYDKALHRLSWAQEMVFPGNPEHTVNYNLRLLGRESVLVLNAVGDMRQLEQIRGAMRQVADFSNFSPKHRYTDFNGTFDNVAYHDVAALVRGKAPRVSKTNRFWTRLSNFHLIDMLVALGILVFVVVRVRALVKKVRPGADPG